jgi:glycosyltransferase involved in cell wall biosynthesis
MMAISRSATLERAPHVLYLNPTADLYGASRCLLNLLAHRDPGDWEATVILPTHGALEARLREIGVAVRVAPNLAVVRKGLMRPRGLAALAGALLSSAWVVARIAREVRADVVHTNSAVVLSGALAARLARRPHVWHVREIMASNAAVWRWYAPLMLRASQRVVCVSQAAANQFAPFRLRRGACVIYDGLDFERIAYPSGQAQARASFGLPANAVVVGTMGYLNPRKGADLLIEAIARVKAEHEGPVRLVVAGEPYPGHEGYAEQLRARTRALGLDSDIVFAGFIEDVARFFAAIDVFALSAHEPEGYGLTLVEATAAGVPTVATGLGGMREVIDDGVTGCFVSPNSVEELAAVLLDLLRDPVRRARMGVAARQRAVEHFSLERTVAELRALYAAVVGEQVGELGGGRRSDGDGRDAWGTLPPPTVTRRASGRHG